jgi:hypothetical protein
MSLQKLYLHSAILIVAGSICLFGSKSYAEYSTPPEESFLHSPDGDMYGRGRAMGMQACPYDYKTADQYDDSGMT